jgi:polyisoprenyl-phosphate glycosyltransferase
MKQIGFILPVFREEEVIELFHQELMASIELIEDLEFRIVYVVDPSQDRTEEILKNLAENNPQIEVLILSRRFGHQASLMAGIDYCDTDILIMMDTDLQHPPRLIHEMIKIYESQKVDIVQAIRNDGPEIRLFKRKTSKLFYKILNWMSGMNVPPGAADFRLISRQVAEIIRERLREKNLFLRGLFSWIGFDTRYISFECHERLHGASKYNLKSMVHFAIYGIFSFSKLPLRLTIWAGVFVVATSIVVGGVDIIRYFFSSQETSGWLSIFSFIVFFGGVQMIVLGIVGEYIGLIFDEVKQRPNYIIHRVYKK